MVIDLPFRGAPRGAPRWNAGNHAKTEKVETMFHNIEKSALRPGSYVGYATGAWPITGRSGAWTVSSVDYPGRRFTGRTLREVSAWLDATNEEIAREIRRKAAAEWVRACLVSQS
jgi:hypothetical protein